MHSFDSSSSNIDEVLSINTSANVFIFGDFNSHHNNWLTYSDEIDRTWWTMSTDLAKMVNFLTWIPKCDFHSPSLLDWLVSSNASFVLNVFNHPLENYDHVFVSVSIDFQSNSKQDASFHHKVYDYMTFLVLIGMIFVIIWKMFHGRISLNSVEFYEWLQVGIDVYPSWSIRLSLTHLYGFCHSS